MPLFRGWVRQRPPLPWQSRALARPRAVPVPISLLVLGTLVVLGPGALLGGGPTGGALTGAGPTAGSGADRSADAGPSVRAASSARPAVRINAGGDRIVDAQGRNWLADDVTGVRGQRSDSKYAVVSDTPQVDGTERYGDLRLEVPVVAPGSYLLRLHLTELYWDEPGKRIFDVWVQGAPVALRIDLLETGDPGRTQLMDIPVQVDAGELEVELRRVRDNASFTALELLPTDGAGQVSAEAPPGELTQAQPGPESAEPGARTKAPPPAAGSAPPGRPAQTTGPGRNRQLQEGTGGIDPSGASPSPADTVIAAPPPAPSVGPRPRRSPGPSTQPRRPPSPTPAAAPVPKNGRNGVVSVREFGARGDGRTDDTKALQRAFDEVAPGTSLQLPAGGVFLHSDVLHLRRAGLRLTGPGELRATRQERSSLWIESDRVSVADLRLTITGVTKRWSAWEQHRIRLLPVSGVVLRKVEVQGSAASGIFVGGAADFLLDKVTVRGTRADGIHMTSGAHDGRVLEPTTIDTGDDGVAVVSYRQDGKIVHDITVRAPTVLGTSGGRGLSVVGGENITYTDIDVQRSSAAGVYIANEGKPYFTAAPRNIQVLGGRIRQANTDRSIDHGAVLVLAGDNARPNDVLISDLDIAQTRSSASRSVGVVTYGKPPVDVVLDRLRITGGPTSPYQGNTTSGYVRTRWTVDGRAVPDERR